MHLGRAMGAAQLDEDPRRARGDAAILSGVVVARIGGRPMPHDRPDEDRRVLACHPLKCLVDVVSPHLHVHVHVCVHIHACVYACHPLKCLVDVVSPHLGQD